MLDPLIGNPIFAADTPPGAGPVLQMLPVIALIMGMFYLMILRPNQKRERERRTMLSALKKNDRVVTMGGIKGVVMNVKPEDDEVVLKVDDDSGTKLRVVLSSIARVVTPADESAGAKKES